MSQTEKADPLWDKDGYPINLAAAAADAENWLCRFHNEPAIYRWLERSGDSLDRLQRAIANIKKFVSDGEEVTVDSHSPS